MSFFDVRLIPTLPPMAWLYRMPRESRPELLHGKSVEAWPNGFFEGCFAGRWRTEDSAECSEVFGSGLHIEHGLHQFVTPSHTLEALFTLSRADEMAVSNSLCFLLEFYRVTLPVDLNYGPRFASAVFGIDAYEQHLARTTAGDISRVLFDNLTVTRDLKTSYTRKPLAPPFTTYRSYAQYLTDVLRSAFANAGDPKRTVQFTPLATCSTGYDSAAGAALAKPLGCRTAITLKNSRGGGIDTGRQVGQALGLEVVELERAQSVESFQEMAEFLATGMGGEDYCFRYFAPLLDRRILLTGFHGGKIWDLRAKPNAVLARADISGSSLQEFRLHRNFIHLPVPMIAARRHSDVAAISQQEEMRPYRLNHYDRPIPRRLLEECGVARELFGQEKKAASILFFLEKSLIPPTARQARNKLVPIDAATRAKMLLLGLSWHARFALYRLVKKAGSIFPWSIGLLRWIVGDWRIFEHHRPQAVLDFLGGLTMTQRRYSTRGCATPSQLNDR
jgi:hypothetical protein